jgi:hypothetical protein
MKEQEANSNLKIATGKAPVHIQSKGTYVSFMQRYFCTPRLTVTVPMKQQ